jgi:phage shock protein A
MMQNSEIQKRFSNVEQAIGKAAQACMSDTSAPQDLKDCIQKLDQQSDKARQVLQSQDENRIRQCVDDLEQLGDQAVEACQDATNIKPELKSAVQQAHSELSNLKRQLH